MLLTYHEGRLLNSTPSFFAILFLNGGVRGRSTSCRSEVGRHSAAACPHLAVLPVHPPAELPETANLQPSLSSSSTALGRPPRVMSSGTLSDTERSEAGVPSARHSRKPSEERTDDDAAEPAAPHANGAPSPVMHSCFAGCGLFCQRQALAC